MCLQPVYVKHACKSPAVSFLPLRSCHVFAPFFFKLLSCSHFSPQKQTIRHCMLQYVQHPIPNTHTHCSYSWRNAPCTTNNRVVCRISDELLTHDCGLQPHSKAAVSRRFQEPWDCDPLFLLACLWEDIFTPRGTQLHICYKLTLTRDSHNYYYETFNIHSFKVTSRKLGHQQ